MCKLFKHLVLWSSISSTALPTRWNGTAISWLYASCVYNKRVEVNYNDMMCRNHLIFKSFKI